MKTTHVFKLYRVLYIGLQYVHNFTSVTENVQHMHNKTSATENENLCLLSFDLAKFRRLTVLVKFRNLQHPKNFHIFEVKTFADKLCVPLGTLWVP